MFTEVPTELKKIGQQAFNWFKSIDWVGLGKSVITFIGNAIKGLFTSIPSLIKSIGQSAFNLFKSIDWAGLGKSVINFIRNAIHGLFNSIPQLLKSIGSSAKSSFENINWKGIGSNVINWISNGIKGLINNIPKVLSSIASRAKSSFTSVNWGSIGSNVISGIASGISRGIGSVISAAQRVARNALSAAKRALGIHSPSTVFRDEVGAMISKGMGIGIDDNAPIDTVQNTMANIISAAKDGISNVDIPISASVSNGANGDSIAQIQADTTKDIYSFITGKMVTQLANVIADKLTVELDGREVGRVVKKYA
jgi:phage-related protein